MRLAECPFCRTKHVDFLTNESCHFSRVICNNPKCGAEGPISRTVSGPEWRLAVEHSAAVLWNDAACRLPGWGKV